MLFVLDKLGVRVFAPVPIFSRDILPQHQNNKIPIGNPKVIGHELQLKLGGICSKEITKKERQMIDST